MWDIVYLGFRAAPYSFETQVGVKLDEKGTKNNPLNFPPGSQQVYSNFGYMLLAAIVTKASSMEYGEYVHKNILEPIGVSSSDFQLFSFSPAINSQQYLRTPNSITGVQCSSIFPGNKGAAVLATEQGCINSVNWFGVSTSITTSQAMARVAANYKLDTATSLDGPQSGVPLNGATNKGMHYGIVPGVNNLLRQLTSGSSYALMFNKDNNSVTSSGEWQNTLYPKIDAIIANAGY
jgi:CubicO group peptidase (beta-lactamase class C family)